MSIRLVIGLAVLLTGCVTPSSEPPVVAARSVTRGDGVVVAPNEAPIADSRSIGLQRIQFNMPRGAEIAYIRTALPVACSGIKLGGTYHTPSPSNANPPEWRDAFHMVMTGHGYRVPNAPDNLFADQVPERPEYLVGANVTAAYVEGSVQCNPVIPYRVMSLTGKSSITVEWQVFDPLTKQVVLRQKVDGAYASDRALPPDIQLMLKLAFADSANNFAADQAMRELVVSPVKSTAANPPASVAQQQALARRPLSGKPVDAQIDHLRSATVMIEDGSGHGSGVLVSEDGWILTNHHVVAGQRFARIRMLSGRSVVGEVMQSHPVRDIALIKIEGTGYPAVSIRETPAKVAEEVYAIGAPQSRELGWTVTRGVISAHRKAMPPDKQDMLQVDIGIHGGNSGGPLLDRQGNLIALCVAGFTQGRGISSNLNLFIPIMDGLGKLGLDLVDPAEFERRRKVVANRHVTY